MSIAANGCHTAHSTSSTVQTPLVRRAVSASFCSWMRRGAARDRLLNELLLAAEMVVEQRDVHVRTLGDQAVRERLEAVIGDQRLDRVEEPLAGVVAATRRDAACTGCRRLGAHSA